ncbi:MAG: hypothetical protein HWN79_17640 [Candidatus Lokiarchaeota archaeon]|nr:hypothetical protein [Candidatus Lokiarchaeota archaeon]
MNSRFRVGDIVRIAKNSRYYGVNKGDHNPPDTNGRILDIDSSGWTLLPINVTWYDTGDYLSSNDAFYGENDLRLVRRQ